MVLSRKPDSQRGPEGLRYELVVRQMPSQARASSRKCQERRALDPIPAVELVFREPDESGKRVRVPHHKVTGYTLLAVLVDAQSGRDIEYLWDGQTEALCGSRFSSVFPVRDPSTEERRSTLFFAFPHLGVRETGRFKLRFTLLLFGPKGSTTPLSVCSLPFSVVSAAKYNGVHNATDLTRALFAGGVHARNRKSAKGAHSCRDPSADAEVPDHHPPGRPRRPSKPRSRRWFIHAPQPRYPSREAPALLARAAECEISRVAASKPLSPVDPTLLMPSLSWPSELPRERGDGFAAELGHGMVPDSGWEDRLSMQYLLDWDSRGCPPEFDVAAVTVERGWR
ncbi:velvet factor-domain-containing protein [Mycena polygramma]|nr:velvet factor-domain-containing protein [Mycena polygramma]